MIIICEKNTYSREERARAILFEGVDIDAFIPTFIFEGKQYYRRIK